MAILSSTAATNKQRQFTAHPGDPDSLSLVAPFLEEDLRFAVDAQVAQALQLELALGGSHPASQTGSIDACTEAEQESDQLVSLRLQLDLVNPTLPKARIARMNPSAGMKPERPAGPSHEKKEDPRPPTPVPECLFCFALTRAVADPYKNSLSPSSSMAASLGMYLGDRADEHLAYLDCLAAYINTQLDDISGRKASPVCCPLCPYQLTDVDAARILGPENLEAWQHQKTSEGPHRSLITGA
ncbi:hypothetical protein JCM1841_003269 [Sporobolomyces salmonicolor]